MPLTVGLTFDIRARLIPKGAPHDLFAEHDSEETVGLIEEAVISSGRKALRIGPAKELSRQLDRTGCDIIFNIAEGRSGRNRESEVPVLLDIAGMPYVGSDALTLSAALDKVIAKKVFKYHGIPTPEYAVFDGASGSAGPHPDFPVIVKPRFEGSAKGIDTGSVVRDEKALKTAVKKVTGHYGQDALVEEFIDGWEFTVGMIGNDNPRVFPVVQRHLEAKTGLSSHVLKKEGFDRDKLVYRDLMGIDPALEAGIADLALKAYRGFECRDFARMDFRIKKTGRGYKVYMLEINPLPSLAKDDYFAMVAELEGLEYPDMINMVLESALRRYKIR